MCGYRLTVVFAAAVLLFAACASAPGGGKGITGDALVYSGFEKRYADSPEKFASLEGQPQHVLTRHNRNGRILYTYADASGCRCLYVGNQQAYDNLRGDLKEIGNLNAGVMDWEVWQ